MKLTKLLMPFILSASSLSAFSATPEKIDSLTKMDVYLAKDSIKRKGDDVSYALIFDFKQTDTLGKKNFKSVSAYYGGSCTSGTTKERLAVFHIENMGEGKVLMWDKGDPEFKLGLPQQYADKYTDIVCKIK